MSNLLSSRELSLLCPDCNHRLGSHKAQDKPGCLESGYSCVCKRKVSEILEYYHKEKEEEVKTKVKVSVTTALELFSERRRNTGWQSI